MLKNRLDRAISVESECFSKGRRVESVAYPKVERVPLNVVQWRCAQHRRRHRQDDDSALEFGKLVKGPQSLRHDILMRREMVVGQSLPIGQGEDWHVSSREQRQFPFEELRFGGRGDHHDQRAIEAGQIGNGGAAGSVRHWTDCGASPWVIGPWEIDDQLAKHGCEARSTAFRALV